MTEIKVQIQYTPEDLQRAYEAHLFSYYPIRTRLLLIFGVISVLYFIFALVLYLIRDDAYSFSFQFFFLLYGIAMILYYRWKINRMGKTIFKQLDDFKAPMDFTISEELVYVSTSNGTSANRTWNSFIKVLIMKDMILLYPNQINFLFFPANYFSVSDFENLKKLAKAKINDVLEK
jgi:hypothetical protein